MTAYVIPRLVELWGPAGHAFLNETRMGDAYEYRLESLRDLIEVYDGEIAAAGVLIGGIEEMDRRRFILDGYQDAPGLAR